MIHSIGLMTLAIDIESPDTSQHAFKRRAAGMRIYLLRIIS